MSCQWNPVIGAAPTLLVAMQASLSTKGTTTATTGQNSLVPPSGLLPALIIPSGAATVPSRFSDGILPPANGTECLVPAFRLTPGLMIVLSALMRHNSCTSSRMPVVNGAGFLALVPTLPLGPTARNGLSTLIMKSTACCLATTSGNEFQVV